VSDFSGNEWEPAIAADAKGNLAVAWDTYQKGDYDVYVARRGSDGKFQPPQPVAGSLAFEVRPSIAYDREGQLWIAWEESGDRWGKDFGALKKQGIAIYQAGRSIAAKVMRADGAVARAARRDGCRSCRQSDDDRPPPARHRHGRQSTADGYQRVDGALLPAAGDRHERQRVPRVPGQARWQLGTRAGRLNVVRVCYPPFRRRVERSGLGAAVQRGSG
jgi:hypothetical protein